MHINATAVLLRGAPDAQEPVVDIQAGLVASRCHHWPAAVCRLYPWLRLPEEVYSLVQLTSHDGADMLYNRSAALGALSSQLSGGNSIGREQYALDDMHDMDFRDVFATSLALSTESFGTFFASAMPRR